jgi:hypothetical protein
MDPAATSREETKTIMIPDVVFPDHVLLEDDPGAIAITYSVTNVIEHTSDVAQLRSQQLIRAADTDQAGPSEVRFLCNGMPIYDNGYTSYGWIFTNEDGRNFRDWEENLSTFYKIADIYVGADDQLLTEVIMRELNHQDYLEIHGKSRYTPFTLGEAGTSTSAGHVNTMYNKVADKVRPSDEPRPPTEMQFGKANWVEREMHQQLANNGLRPPDIGSFDHLFERRHAPFPRGTRFTPERMAAQVFGT